MDLGEIIMLIILLGGGPILFYIGFYVFDLIGKGFDTLFLKKGREKRAYNNTVQWFETNNFYDGLSPYIREYLRTGHLDDRYYNIEEDLANFVGFGNGLYPSTYRKGAYYEDWKETILEYRSRLIKNLNNKNYKDYKTKKGTIRIVPIKKRGWDLSITEGTKVITAISPDTLRFDRYHCVPDAYVNILGKFGFTFIRGHSIKNGWFEFEVVAYINLG